MKINKKKLSCQACTGSNPQILIAAINVALSSLTCLLFFFSKFIPISHIIVKKIASKSSAQTFELI
jgi:hypothetical protein